MGLVALIAIFVYAWVAISIGGAVAVSSVRFRAVPMFWVIAATSLVVVPLIMNGPLPEKQNTDYGAFSYFLESTFSRFNLVCFCGGLVSLLVASAPIGALRIASAVSWGFASALAVRLFLLFGS